MKKINGKKLLSDIKLHSDYLKWREDLNRYETWEEACEDIINGHRQKYQGIDIEEELTSALESMKEMRVFASQRNLQFRYPQVKRSSLRLFNCSVLHAVNNNVFQNTCYLLINGCGVGVSLLKPFVDNISSIKAREDGTKTFVIEDSIEGWADAFGVLMSSYLADNQPFPEYSNCKIRFDYSLIRAKETFISGGFKAPGPEPLKNSLEKIEKFLDTLIDRGIHKLKPIHIFDIICHISDCILSGGVRRSALLMVVDPHDKEMIYAKTGNWRNENPQRARSNNSVLLLRNLVSKEQFEEIVNLNNGDNDIGFIFGNSWFDMFNPCFTGDTKVLTTNGWKTFKEMVEIQKSGKDIFIYQDKRVSGDMVNNIEQWNVDNGQNGLLINKIGKVGITGKNVEILEIETSCGRSVKCTKNHKFFTYDGKTVEAKDLIIGKDKLLISHNDLYNPNKNSIEFKNGFIAGLVFGDGFKTDDQAGISFWFKEDNDNNNKLLNQVEDIFKDVLDNAIKNNQIKSSGYKPLKSDLSFRLQKQVGSYIKYTLQSTGLKKLLNTFDMENKSSVKFLFNKDKDFQSGFISGMIHTDGSVEYGVKNKTLSVRISQSNKTILQDLSLILQDLGYIPRLYNMASGGYKKLPDTNRNPKYYLCKDSFRLVINGQIQCKNLLSKILLLEDDKKDKLRNMLDLSVITKPVCGWSIVKSITQVENEDVYCLEENNNRTLIANGITAARCAEIQFTPILTDKDLTQITYEELPDFIKDNSDMFGVQVCNLTSMNAEKIKNKEDFLRACKDEAILGTLQAGYTNFPYFKDKSEEITKRESLLGTSITGWMNNPKILNSDWLKDGVKVILEINEKLATKLGINKAARTTCVKPEGNLSVIAQTSSGFHPEHSMRYFRIMQINKSSDVAKYLIENCPYLLEESVWSANGVDYVIFVPVVNPTNGVFKDTIKGVKHLELIKFAQENWVIPGTRQECGISPKINHNISATVILDDKQSVIDYIWDNKDSFTAVSFISDYGDKDFNQAPFTSVLNVEEIFEKYGKGALFVSGLIVDGLHYFNNNLWEACDYLIHTDMQIFGTREQVMLKKYWLQRAKKFAKNYFKGDLKETVYCLKDVHLCHKWENITREMKDINFQEILKKPEYKDVSNYAAMACSGKDGCNISKI